MISTGFSQTVSLETNVTTYLELVWKWRKGHVIVEKWQKYKLFLSALSYRSSVNTGTYLCRLNQLMAEIERNSKKNMRMTYPIAEWQRYLTFTYLHFLKIFVNLGPWVWPIWAKDIHSYSQFSCAHIYSQFFFSSHLSDKIAFCDDRK